MIQKYSKAIDIMSGNRFFVSESGFDTNQVRLDPDQAHQVCHVLRLKAGDEIVVLDNAGYEYDATLTQLSKREVVGRITDKRPAGGEPRVSITLFQSLLAREKFEWVLQKGTEAGVCRFVPVQTSRSIMRAKQIDDKRLARWRKIITEAAEQSHRGRIPQIDGAIDLPEAISQSSDFDLALIATPTAESPTLKQILEPRTEKPTSVALFIGPEGGFAPNESDLACTNMAKPVRLGPRIFRAETAGPVTSALILFVMGDLDA